MTVEDVLQCLRNPTRLRCLHLLAQSDEVCVCEFVDRLGISQPTASKALSALKAAGFLSDRRDANWNYYRLSARMPGWQSDLVNAVIAGLQATSADTLAAPPCGEPTARSAADEIQNRAPRRAHC
jgi:ArsR family transcriptional regulator